MIKYRIKIDPKRWKSLDKFEATFNGNIKLAMRKSVSALQGQIRINLSGPSHTLFPGNSNPFPGTLSGRMKNSINFQITGQGTTLRGIVGPDTIYSQYQDNLRPYLKPTLDSLQDEINNNFTKAVEDSLKA